MKIQDDFFKEINSKEKAYILGFIGSDGHIGKTGVSFNIHSKDKYILETIKNIISPELKVKSLKNLGLISTLYIPSKQIVDDLKKIFKLRNTSEKFKEIRLPEIPKEFLYDFLRGYFDGDGCIRKPTIYKRTLDCSICSSSQIMLKQIQEKVDIPSTINGNAIYWYSNNALDFLGKLYDNEENLFLIRKKNRYLQWANYFPHKVKWRNNLEYDNLCVLKYKKTLPEAIDPFKKRVSDSGFDLTAIKLLKKDGKLYSYDTGIALQPNFGWYLDAFPRSSIHKYGFMLANSVGVIDRTYTGNVIVNLFKIDESKPDFELPFRVIQIVPRPIIHPVLIEIKEGETIITIDDKNIGKNGVVVGNGDNNTFYDTERGEKGFGSSDGN